MHFGQLRWLGGFMFDGRWHQVDGEPAEAPIDGLALARARRTINTLRRDHGGSLRRIVGDVPAWLAAAEGVLRHLDAHVHGRQAADELDRLAPPRVRTGARVLASQHPRLGPLIRAATSAWITRPPVLAAVLAWMQPRAETLSLLIAIDGGGAPALRRVLRLALLGVEEAAGVDAVLALALADVPDGNQVGQQIGNLIGRLRTSHRVEAPAPKRSTAVVIAWIDRMLAREGDERARALELLAAIDLARALEPWRVWERAHGTRIARAAALAREQGIDRGANPEDIRRVIEGIERARAALPAVIDVAEMLVAVDVLSGHRFESFHRAALQLMPLLPGADAPLTRVRFAEHSSVVASTVDGDQRAAWLWEAVARELARGAPPRMRDLWLEVLGKERRWAWLEEHILDPLKSPAEVRRFAAALAHLARTAPVSTEQARRLAAALAGGLGIEQAAALTTALGSVAGYPSERLVRAAVALAGRDVTALVAPIRAMAVQCEEGGETDAAMAAFCDHAAATGAGWLMLGLLARDARRAIELAELAACVPRRSWPTLPVPPRAPAWIAGYPAELAGALTRLAATDADAERTARRRVAALLPERAALESEVAALRARRPLGPRQAKRLANLETRIRAPRPPSRGQLERLAAKLDATALESGAARFAATLTDAARARLADRLGIAELPEWRLDRMQRSILTALVELDPRDRALAGRLLHARRGPPPWDLRDDRRNRAFLADLRARGVDPSPWLDDEPRRFAAADGQPVELALSPDPLEVFEMGAHFDTCLAPRGGNFFSVITNAADVNKRVLYARRQGKVVGRCLLALTDSGHLLAFQPYAHDAKLGFDALVSTFVLDLARRMGSQVASAGKVTTLLGRDWYDDGARDIVGRYARLEREAFKRAVREVRPAELVALLERTLGRALDDVTLPVVLSSGAVLGRPELIAPLAPYLLARTTLPEQTLNMAADMATRHGDRDLADRLLIGPASRAALEFGAWHWGQVLARWRPSFALARLHQTRPRGVRGLAAERGERLAVAGLALEQLHRPRQAAAFYRRAIADEEWLANELNPRLEALERQPAR